MGFNNLVHLWTSETSQTALRTKQLLASLLPEKLLLEVKKRYYLFLLNRPGTELMELDARALHRIVKPGDSVVDIGAFVGFYTKFLSSLVGPAGRVLSVEPIPHTYEILAWNIRALALNNVQLFNCAISDFEGVVTMEIPRYRNGGECWYDARIVSEPPTQHLRRLEAYARTLDSLVRNLDRPISFVKCDAEYHELGCVRGAVDMIQRWKPVWLIEMLRSPDEEGSDQRKTLEFLQQRGYIPYWYDGTDFRVRRPGQRSQNLFFFPIAMENGSSIDSCV